MSHPERDRLIEERVQRCREVLQRQLEREPRTLDETAQAVEDVSMEMDRVLEQRILDEPAIRPEYRDKAF